MDENRNYQCRKQGCTKVFKRSNARAKHERLNCKAEGEIVVASKVAKGKDLFLYCSNSWCRRVFNKEFNRNRHEKICRENVPNICKICKNEFKRKEHLKYHQKTQ